MSSLTPTAAQAAIATLDETVLSTLREGWLDATAEKKSKWMERINSALDERLRLMAVRDHQQPALTRHGKN
jgi:hypothetical protein